MTSESAGRSAHVDNPHFAAALSWDAARVMLAFRPLEPKFTAGHSLEGLRVHIRDHKLRDLSVAERTLEVHYAHFVLSQSRKGVDEARRLALVVSYGVAPRETRISGREARVYDLGPEPPPDDIDGRRPAVVTWCDGDMFFLIASSEMSSDVLVNVANSVYA